MEAQLGLLLGRYATPLEAAALLGAGWAGALEAAGEVAGADASRAFAPDRGAAWADFGARFRALAQGPGADPGALARAANRAMARSLGDCHTSLAASHEREVRSLDGAERYGGVGASVADPATFEPRPPGPLVVQVTEGGPAEQAGIRAGDAVLAVDGTDAAGLPPARLVELVRGEAGTPVRLRLDRPGAPAPVEVTVERALLEPRPVEGRLLSVPGAAPGAGAPRSPGAPGAQVGYVALREFSRAAEAALPAKLEELRAAGATHWVLDLRGNRGGNLQTFTRLGSLFLEEGTLAVTIDRNGAESSHQRRRDGLPSVPAPPGGAGRPAVRLGGGAAGGGLAGVRRRAAVRVDDGRLLRHQPPLPAAGWVGVVADRQRPAERAGPAGRAPGGPRSGRGGGPDAQRAVQRGRRAPGAGPGLGHRERVSPASCPRWRGRCGAWRGAPAGGPPASREGPNRLPGRGLEPGDFMVVCSWAAAVHGCRTSQHRAQALTDPDHES